MNLPEDEAQAKLRECDMEPAHTQTAEPSRQQLFEQIGQPRNISGMPSPILDGVDLTPVPRATQTAEQVLQAKANDLLRRLCREVFEDAIDIAQLPHAVGLVMDFATAFAAHELAAQREYAEYWEGRTEAVEKELAAARTEIARLKRLFHDLTPGGSEFVNDPDYCAKYIRERSHMQHEIAKKAIIRAQKAEAGSQREPGDRA